MLTILRHPDHPLARRLLSALGRLQCKLGLRAAGLGTILLIVPLVRVLSGNI